MRWVRAGGCAAAEEMCSPGARMPHQRRRRPSRCCGAQLRSGPATDVTTPPPSRDTPPPPPVHPVVIDNHHFIRPLQVWSSPLSQIFGVGVAVGNKSFWWWGVTLIVCWREDTCQNSAVNTISAINEMTKSIVASEQNRAPAVVIRARLARNGYIPENSRRVRLHRPSRRCVVNEWRPLVERAACTLLCYQHRLSIAGWKTQRRCCSFSWLNPGQILNDIWSPSTSCGWHCKHLRAIGLKIFRNAPKYTLC